VNLKAEYSTAVSEPEFDNLVKINPNPASQSVLIDFSKIPFNVKEVFIYDLNGNIIIKFPSSMITNSAGNIFWDLTDMTGKKVTQGFYNLRIVTAKSTTDIPIIIAK
jgi:flagellar hook assembly protein FlgD